VVDADNEEDVVMDAANTLSDKGGRGGNNNNNNYGGEGGNMDNVVVWQLHCMFPRKRMGGV
jgi:hypothetical protein